MRSSSAWGRIIGALGLLGALCAARGPAREANAALVCQHQSKPRAHVRVKTCRKKETVVFDTAVDSARGDALAADQKEMATALGLVCAEDPARRLLTVDRDVAGLMSLGYLGGPLCRTLDDDLGACAEAYEVGPFGAVACAPIEGKCMPCYQPLEVVGLCRNVCQPALACTADPARTLARTECADATTPDACSRSWTTTTDYATPTDIVRATSCYWNATAMPAVCAECTPDETSRGRCANSCISVSELPRCRLGGRSYGQCAVLDGNAAACAMTYELSALGTQTCWYDTGSGDCRGCDPFDEAEDRCHNGC